MSYNLCKDEFSRSKLFLNVERTEDFYTFQWSNSRKAYFFYRFASLLYMIAWMIVNIEVYSTKNKYFWHFTHWNVVLVSLYFFFSFAVTLHGLITQKNGKVQEPECRWYHKIILLLQYAAFNSSMIVTVVFWTLLAPSKSADYLATPNNVHIHGVILLLVVIDLFLIKTPVYLVTFVYNILYGLVYILFTYLLHVSGVTSRVYSFLNYAKNPSLAAGIGIGMGFGAAILGQALQYGLFCLRTFLYRRCKNNNTEETCGV